MYWFPTHCSRIASTSYVSTGAALWDITAQMSGIWKRFMSKIFACRFVLITWFNVQSPGKNFAAFLKQISKNNRTTKKNWKNALVRKMADGTLFHFLASEPAGLKCQPSKFLQTDDVRSPPQMFINNDPKILHKITPGKCLWADYRWFGCSRIKCCWMLKTNAQRGDFGDASKHSQIWGKSG